jgi:phenylalanyl-tRNA synthetase beta chain
MNIKILDSHLREFLKTSVTPLEFAKVFSLTSASVERVEKHGDDYIYDIEITTNRPDLMSVLGIAKEAHASLSQSGKSSKLSPLIFKKPQEKNEESLSIKNNPKLVNRICAVVLSVNVKESPKFIKDRLEAMGIRSLNNLIDVTNYVMRETGHPAHVFDLDKIPAKTIVVRESSKAEKIKTLDGKEYVLQGGDIVADDGEGNIIDLLGIMGLENSVVSNETKKILFFIDNNDPLRIRKTSMALGIRSEAAVLNEKGVDSEKAYNALLRGIELYEQIADGKVISPIYDIYPNKPKEKMINVSAKKVSSILGLEIKESEIKNILTKLGFGVSKNGGLLEVSIPSDRNRDIEIEEDVIEEIARIYGYHKLPSILPRVESITASQFTDNFYWEERARNSLKYWGFSESYSYSMVSSDLFDGEVNKAVKIANPLNEDLVYMRRTIVPSLLQIVNENKSKNEVKLFELANTYHKKANNLPEEIMTLAAVLRKENISFYEAKGIIEQLATDLGVALDFKKSKTALVGASIFIGKNYLGEIEVLDNNLIDFELNFNDLIKHATLTKKYKPIAKYPPVIEDMAFTVPESIETSKIVNEIQSINPLITEVSLLDQFGNTRTFHVVYQDPNKNLTTKEISEIREKIIKSLKEKFEALPK